MKRGFLIMEKDIVRLYTVTGGRDSPRIDDCKTFADIESVEVPDGFDSFLLSIPAGSLNFRLLDMPFAEKDRLREVIPYELQALVLDPIEDIVFDTLLLSGENGRYRILVPYIKTSELKRILMRLQSKGIEPSVVTSIGLLSLKWEAPSEKLLDIKIELSDSEAEELIKAEINEPAINLRQGSFSVTKEERERYRLIRRLLYTTVILLLSIAINLGILIYRESRDIRGISEGMDAIYTGLFPDVKKVINPLHQLKAKTRELKTELKQIRGIHGLDLLGRLSDRWTAGAVLVELTANPDFITIKAEASSLKDIESLTSSLEGSLGDIELAESNQTVGGKLLFVLKATSGEADIDKEETE